MSLPPISTHVIKFPLLILLYPPLGTALGAALQPLLGNRYGDFQYCIEMGEGHRRNVGFHIKIGGKHPLKTMAQMTVYFPTILAFC